MQVVYKYSVNKHDQRSFYFYDNTWIRSSRLYVTFSFYSFLCQNPILYKIFHYIMLYLYYSPPLLIPVIWDQSLFLLLNSTLHSRDFLSQYSYTSTGEVRLPCRLRLRDSVLSQPHKSLDFFSVILTPYHLFSVLLFSNALHESPV